MSIKVNRYWDHTENYSKMLSNNIELGFIFCIAYDY